MNNVSAIIISLRRRRRRELNTRKHDIVISVHPRWRYVPIILRGTKSNEMSEGIQIYGSI